MLNSLHTRGGGVGKGKASLRREEASSYKGMLSVSVDRFAFSGFGYKWNQNVYFFLVWLPSYNIMSLGFVHISSSFLRVAERSFHDMDIEQAFSLPLLWLFLMSSSFL